MDAKDIRNLSEAYSQVYQVDEELTGSRRQIAIEKGAPSRLIHGVHGSEKNGKITNFQTKLSGRGRKGKPKSGLNLGGFEDDRGKGNKAARRAGKFVKNTRDDEKDSWDESYDYYDIILSHLLDEGYAETEEAAHKIMVNMSEEWRESIVENVSSGRSKVRNVKQRVSSAEVITNTERQNKIAQHFSDHAAKKKSAGDEAHAAATKAGKSPSDAETARQRAHREYEKSMRG